LLAQKKVTQEKGTPLPRPYGLNLDLLKKSGGRPNSGLKALRQVRPTAPDFFSKSRRGRGEEKLPSPPAPLPGGEGSYTIRRTETLSPRERVAEGRVREKRVEAGTRRPDWAGFEVPPLCAAE